MNCAWWCWNVCWCNSLSLSFHLGRVHLEQVVKCITHSVFCGSLLHACKESLTAVELSTFHPFISVQPSCCDQLFSVRIPVQWTFTFLVCSGAPFSGAWREVGDVWCSVLSGISGLSFDSPFLFFYLVLLLFLSCHFSANCPFSWLLSPKFFLFPFFF